MSSGQQAEGAYWLGRGLDQVTGDCPLRAWLLTARCGIGAMCGRADLAVADGEAAAAAFGNVQAFGSPRGGVMMSIAMPHQGIGAAMGMQSSLARSVHMQQEGAGAMRPWAPLGCEQAPYLGE